MLPDAISLQALCWHSTLVEVRTSTDAARAMLARDPAAALAHLDRISRLIEVASLPLMLAAIPARDAVEAGDCLAACPFPATAGLYRLAITEEA